MYELGMTPGTNYHYWLLYFNNNKPLLIFMQTKQQQQLSFFPLGEVDCIDQATP